MHSTETHLLSTAVKVRFQTPDLRQKYRSTFHALATITREEKFVGLYKGITSPLVCNIFIDWSMDSCKRYSNITSVCVTGLLRVAERAYICLLPFLHEDTVG
jgi:hypothetical protein